MNSVLIPTVIIVGWIVSRVLAQEGMGGSSCPHFTVGGSQIWWKLGRNTGIYTFGNPEILHGATIVIKCPGNIEIHTLCTNGKFDAEIPENCPAPSTTTTTTLSTTTTTKTTTAAATTTPMVTKTSPSPTTTSNTPEPTTTKGLETTTEAPWTLLPVVNNYSNLTGFEEYLGYTMPLGNGMPLATVTDLLECEFINGYVRNPNDPLERPTEVLFGLTIGDVFEVGNIEETLSFSATLAFAWKVESCSATRTIPHITQSERIDIIDIKQVWHPGVQMSTSPSDIFLKNDKIGDYSEVSYLPTFPNRTLTFYWTRIGNFQSKCELQLQKFPFDEQTCKITFKLVEPNQFVKFGFAQFSPMHLSPNSEWRLIDNDYSIETYPSPGLRGSNVSAISFIIRIQRNPAYMLANILAPCLLLITLLLASFLAPPNDTERVIFSTTVLLALIFAQSELLTVVPRSSQRVLMADYFLLLVGLTAACVTYGLFALWLCFTAPQGVADRKVCGGIRVIRILDFIAFILSFTAFIFINIYAVTVVNS